MRLLLPVFSKFVPSFVVDKVHPVRQMAEKSKYRYVKQNFSFVVSVEGSKPSLFDNELVSRWAKCLEEGLFRYEVSIKLVMKIW